MPVNDLLDKFRRYTGIVGDGFVPEFDANIYNPSLLRSSLEVHSMLPEADVIAQLSQAGVKDIKAERVTLEDAFIGLTGKY